MRRNIIIYIYIRNLLWINVIGDIASVLTTRPQKYPTVRSFRAKISPTCSLFLDLFRTSRFVRGEFLFPVLISHSHPIFSHVSASAFPQCPRELIGIAALKESEKLLHTPPMLGQSAPTFRNRVAQEPKRLGS